MKASVCLYMQPQRQGWKAAVSSPPCPPTQRPSHQVGGWQSTLIGQLRPPVHWKQRAHGFPSQKKMISISSISPHKCTPAAVMSRGWFRTENYLDINSYAIILLWWAFAEDLKRWLRISRNACESSRAREACQTSARSWEMETDVVNVNGSQWG